MRLSKSRVIFFWLILLGFHSAHSNEYSQQAMLPSFDCNKANAEIEKAICDSSELANLDRHMANSYKSFTGKLSDENRVIAKNMQVLWLKSRAKYCQPDEMHDCLIREYKEWLDASSKGVLMAKTVWGLKTKPVQSPFDPGISYYMTETGSLEKQSNSEVEKDIKIEYYINNNGNEKMFFGGSEYRSGNEHYVEKISHIRFYLTPSGKKYVAYENRMESVGGRCDAYEEINLDFVDVKTTENKKSRVKLLEEDGACGTYAGELFDWDLVHDDKLLYKNLEDYSFYYQQVFHEIKATEIDSAPEDVKQYYWIDQSREVFLGKPYAEIFASITARTNDWAQRPDFSPDPGNCSLAKSGLGEYWSLKEMLSEYHLGFHQISFVAQHVLKPKDLDAAKKYKPVLVAALNYLEHARQLPNWERKIVDATKKYPQIQATSNFYYDGNSEWGLNPFVEAGFYTDKSCYASQPSIFEHASTEEWFYMFWGRRVMKNEVTEAESFLKLIIEML